MNSTPVSKHTLLLLTFLTLLLIAQAALAGTLLFKVEIRERFETLDGMNKKTYGNSSLDPNGNVKGESDDRLLVQRIIAGFSYEQGGNIRCSIRMYDARVWGWSLDTDDFVKNAGTADEFIMNPNEEYFELYDANVELKNLLMQGLTAKLGRQIIWYGDKRIFGPGSWGNSIGWLWDAAHFSYKKGDHFVNAWYGQTKTKDPESFSLTAKHAYQGFGLYTRCKITGNGAVEPFFAWKNNLFHNTIAEEKTYHFGVRLQEKDFHGFNYDITVAKENGDIGDRLVDAYAYVVKAGYKLKTVPMKPNIVAGRIFAGGDDRPNDNTIKTYTRPFGSTDGSHYGRMNIMFWSNLVDNQINLHLDPIKKTHLKISYHNFNLDTPQDKWSYYKYGNRAGNSYIHLGDEIDLQLKTSYFEKAEFQIIYSYFIAGDFVKNNVEANDAQRLFLQCTYKFNLPMIQNKD